MYKILLTSTSFIDTPGEHQVKLFEQGFNIDKMRGPLKAEEILQKSTELENRWTHFSRALRVGDGLDDVLY